MIVYVSKDVMVEEYRVKLNNCCHGKSLYFEKLLTDSASFRFA